MNRAEDAFTVLAPTNDAVLRFYEKKGVTSIEDLGYEYARTLATYHVINDSIDREDFVKSGELPGRTLSGDALKVSFGSEGGGIPHHFVPGAEWGAEHPTRDLCQDHGALPDDRLHA